LLTGSMIRASTGCRDTSARQSHLYSGQVKLALPGSHPLPRRRLQDHKLGIVIRGADARSASSTQSGVAAETSHLE
jgi:hypothetical protein